MRDSLALPIQQLPLITHLGYERVVEVKDMAFRIKFVMRRDRVDYLPANIRHTIATTYGVLMNKQFHRAFDAAVAQHLSHEITKTGEA
tara:strand:- start:33 stop:296 length:264 start_codon:yes stop_codon:yes gene_type:complete